MHFLMGNITYKEDNQENDNQAFKLCILYCGEERKSRGGGGDLIFLGELSL